MLNWIKRNRTKIALASILAMTAVLAYYAAWDAGYSNSYYTATVKSMLTSWHNFFFTSFDVGGFISVDKPALGLWIQALFGAIFGVDGWSMILPEAICAVVSVAALYRLVQRRFGKPTGLIAALFLGLTPVFIAVAHSNNLDSSLIMMMVLAAWALFSAAEKGSLKLLILSMVILGLGFNIKTFQAFFILPAMACTYFFTATTTWGKRIVHLLIGAVVLIAVSFSWILAVELTPEENRPYVGGSETNSQIELMVEYNGIQRIVTEEGSRGPMGMMNEGGDAGALRLWNKELGGQASWLLPMAFFGMLALALRIKRKDAKSKHHLRALIFWSLSLLPMIAYLCIAGFFHRYYTAMMAPSIAALAAIAIAVLWKYYKEKGWKGYLLSIAIAGTTASELYLLSRYPDWYQTISPILYIAGFGSALALIVLRIFKIDRKKILTALCSIGVAGLLAAPAAFSATPMIHGIDPILPMAGPELEHRSPFAFGGGSNQQKLIDFLLDNHSDETYIVAMSGAMSAAPLMLQSGEGVLATGGYTGSDPAMTVERLEQMVEDGEVRYFITGWSKVSNWVRSNFEVAYEEGSGFRQTSVYDLKSSK